MIIIAWIYILSFTRPKDALHRMMNVTKINKLKQEWVSAELIEVLGCSKRVVFEEFLNMSRDEVLRISARRAFQRATLKNLYNHDFMPDRLVCSVSHPQYISNVGVIECALLGRTQKVWQVFRGEYKSNINQLLHVVSGYQKAPRLSQQHCIHSVYFTVYVSLWRAVVLFLFSD